jgi:hypothetical protein
MPTITVELADHRRSFSPGETVNGQVSWQCDAPPQSAELRLIWSTDGRGISDEDIVQTIPFPSPRAAESRPFTLTLPEAPYSFSGTLITLSWSIEVFLQPGDNSGGVGIVLAPGGVAISLPRIQSA